MNHKIRLGPVAVFLAVVTVVLTTLAILTTATTNADKVLSERFARITQIRYGLEADGERFLQAYDEQVAAGAVDAAAIGGTVSPDGGVATTIERDGYTLDIEVSAPDAAGNYEITRWKINKIWNAETPMDDLWTGGV